MPHTLDGRRVYSEAELNRRALREQKEQELQDSIRRSRRRRYLKESAVTPSEWDTKMANQAIHEAKSRKSFNGFRDQLKESLVAECVYHLCSKSIPGFMTDSLNQKSGTIVENMERGFSLDFVRENGGADRLLKHWRKGSNLLAEYAAIIDRTYDSIMERADKDCEETHGVCPEEKSKFFSDLAMATPDQVVESIKDRMVSSINSFMDENKAMKDNVMDIVNTTSVRVEKKPDEESDESVKEESARLRNTIIKRKVRDLQDRSPKSFFGEMVKLTANNIMLDDTVRPQYIGENGKLSMDLIVETSALMLGVIETANTTNMVKIDQDYLNGILESMQKKADDLSKKKRREAIHKARAAENGDTVVI